MALSVLDHYAARTLSSAQVELLQGLEEAGLQVKVNGSANKTIRILRDGLDLGYVNGPVTGHGALVGYKFEGKRGRNDACPTELAPKLIEWACDKFGCTAADLLKHPGGKGGWRTFLLIRTRSVAARAFGVNLPSYESGLTDASFREKFDDDVRKSASLGSAKRLARLKTAPKLPKQVTVLTQAFVRNADVVAEVLYRARDGKCRRCGRDAPFNRPNGTPYLEVHHVKRLADGGEDTIDNAIAICPNCHRQEHFG